MRIWPTGRNNIVDDQHLLAGLDGIGLDLEEIFAVFLFEGRCFDGTGQLAGFPHRHEACSQPQRQTGAKQEASSVQANDDVGFVGATIVFDDEEFEGTDEILVQLRIAKEGENVFEQDAFGGEIWELA